MTQAPQSRSRFVMASVLQSLASKPRSQKQPASVSNAIAHHTGDNRQGASETMESDAIHVDPHFNRNILKRYNAQCSTKTPFREPHPKRVKKASPPHCGQFVGKAESPARLAGSEWSPGRGLALAFCSHSTARLDFLKSNPNVCAASDKAQQGSRQKSQYVGQLD
ncbi:uncharacterized protein MELLADRAFT_111331 [Melampsora larici-populina 98AG31]|uniref:Uncharacterized protein n=1 Tax=Melampsora larici-populina (strain 98AG31 / pathotype 3-4-7) TaxID=747676 RepID=F4S2T2_MELLP|nr:uncharacterized protein MELLADRAFT_111331 [Melampsora larici-populina 98AG31]EGG01072.1 hypothetical protein MELLADRAFT_111331 [Melampsora larici-populina 98AG31]